MEAQTATAPTPPLVRPAWRRSTRCARSSMRCAISRPRVHVPVRPGARRAAGGGSAHAPRQCLRALSSCGTMVRLFCPGALCPALCSSRHSAHVRPRGRVALDLEASPVSRKSTIFSCTCPSLKTRRMDRDLSVSSCRIDTIPLARPCEHPLHYLAGGARP
jgi:hypothetical protein